MRGHASLWIQCIVVTLLLVLVSILGEADAQSTATCPPASLLTIARAGAACNALEAGRACYGSGSLISSGVNDEASSLNQLGDRVPLRDLVSIAAVPSESVDDAAVSLAALSIQTSPEVTDVVTMLLINDAELHSEVVPPIELVMQATGSLTVRAAPANEAEVVASLGVNSSVIATGRHDNWLRVTIPTSGASGWASASLLNVSSEGGVQNLPEVEANEELLQPFEHTTLRIGSSAACEGLLHAGALMQTPSTDYEDAVTLVMNGTMLRLAGTMFVTRQNDMLMFVVVDGIAEIGEGTTLQLIPAGAQSVALLDLNEQPAEPFSSASPYGETLTTALPVNNLPRRFQVTPPQPQAVIDARIRELTSQPPTPIPIQPTAENACRRTIGRDTEIWSGPGEDFEILTVLEAGRRITPVLAATDPFGGVWWQLENSGWVVRDDVVERGDCSEQGVPVTDRIAAPPTNTYSLERCESFNGPVRAGQQVTFEFIPPAWDNLGEAIAALRTDPGRFTFNSEVRLAIASEPFRLGAVTDPLEDRYLRRFTYVWTAEPGTYRITGNWLSYEPSCNLTVAAESMSQ